MLRKITVVFVSLFLGVVISGAVLAENSPPSPPSNKGGKEGLDEKYVIVPGKKSNHERGRVKITIFFDFFCPHCHQFDSVVMPLLQREYGDKLKVTAMGFPILYEDSVIPLEAYELAKDEGKGEEMKMAIFDAIYYQRKDGANHDVLFSIAKSVGLDVEKFRKGLTSGIKKKVVLEGKELAKSYGAKSTPTVIIDGNILLKDLSLAGLGSVINNILEKDKK